MSNIEDYLNKIPEYVPPTIVTDSPNQSISILQDTFLLRSKNRQVEVDGKIEFRWFPQLGAYFEGCTEIFENFNEETETFDVSTLSGEILGKALTLQEGFKSNKYFIKGIFSLDCIVGDPSIPVEEIRFVVPNMGRFDGIPIRYENRSYTGRLSLKLEDRIIVLDKLPDFDDRIQNLKNMGGYNVTYSGQIKFKYPKNLRDLKRDMEIFNCFLQLLNGKQVSAMFYTGIHEGEVKWQDYTPYGTESYNIRGYSCFPYFLKKNDFVLLESLFKNLTNYWQKDDSRTLLKLAVSWYLEANGKPWYHFDTSMILSQSALEMFYNWYIIENEGVIKGKINLDAANKIRLLLFKIGIKNEVPSRCTEIIKFLNSGHNGNDEDAIDSIVLYRNAIVHGDSDKRAKLQNIPSGFKTEAKNLSLWYLELCLLYTLGYNGRYSNRITAEYITDSEIVPWSK